MTFSNECTTRSALGAKFHQPSVSDFCSHRDSLGKTSQPCGLTHNPQYELPSQELFIPHCFVLWPIQSLVMSFLVCIFFSLFFWNNSHHPVQMQQTQANIISCATTVRGLNRACHQPYQWNNRQTSNISRTLAGNKMTDHSDVVGASPVGAAPTTSSFVDLAAGFNGLGKDN